MEVQGYVTFTGLQQSTGNGSPIFVCYENYTQATKFVIAINDQSAGEIDHYEMDFVFNQTTYSINRTVSTSKLSNGAANIFAQVKVKPGNTWQTLTSSTPVPVTVQSTSGQTVQPTPTPNPTSQTTTNNTTSTTKKDDKFYNPLPTDSLIDMFLYIGKGFLALIGAWAVIAIIIGGFRMILAQGNEEAYGQAKKSIQWAVIGVVVALLSFSIIAIVQDLLSANVDTTPIQNVDPNKK
jgi:hypothetical protein